ncbi:MAG: hypothetical protein A2Y12_04975 [Planctomycetes bacterium GWF2_42_9]|nr:MAG: hypothetical protein A2Y12_04975 [Planctomycetes bacterium GWF2_42_9]
MFLKKDLLQDIVHFCPIGTHRVLDIVAIILWISVLALAQTVKSDSKTSTWQIPLDSENFKSVVKGTKDRASDNINATMGVVVSNRAIDQGGSNLVRKCGTGSLFEVSGQVPNRITKKWQLSFTPQNTKQFRYYLLRYKAKGICRDDSKFSVVSLSGNDDSGTRVCEKLIDCTQIVNDDKWHVAIGTKKFNFTAEAVEFEVSTIDSSASFALDSLIFSDQIPQEPQAFVHNAGWDEVKNTQNFSQLDLEGAFNDNYSNVVNRGLQKYAMIIDGGNVFKSELLSVNGIPFKIKEEGNNIITSPEDMSVNQQQVDFLGSKVTRKFFFPISRDDVININIDRNASEAFFILVSEFPATTSRYGGIPDVPFYFNDIEMFSVELVYADGDSDVEFPYSIADQGYVIRRSAGAYAVPVDESRKLKSIVFHNRFFGGTVDIAAVTLNTSSGRVVPKLVEDPEISRVPMLPQPPYRTAYIQKDGDVINCGNSYYEMIINCSNGFVIEKLVNRWSIGTEQALDANSGLQVTVGDQILTGRDFIAETVSVGASKAIIELQSKIASVPLKLTVFCTADDTPQVKMRLSVKNTSRDPVSPEIKFPVLKGIKIDNTADTWVFFPQYRNVISNQEGFHIAANDHTFPMQFYDIYNPKAGLGLAVITHNLNYAPIVYSLSKNNSGVSGFIQYSKELYTIEPNQLMEFTETALVFHNGDWQEAMTAYKDWIKTWYNAKRPASRDWFNKISLLKDYFLSEKVSWQDLKTPPMFNRKTRQFQINEYLKKDKEYWGGLSADAIHFYRWFHIDSTEDNEKSYGVGDTAYGQYSYDNFGGLEPFRSAISKFQKQYNMPVSLYLVPDRCSSGTEIGKRVGEKAVIVRADGSKLAGPNVFYVCPQQKDWQDFLVETAKRVQSDTNADCIYLDVFGLWHTSACYSREHGHRSPSWYNLAAHDLIKRLREALPDHVAIWTEFPLTDLNTQFVDGNIQYYYLSLHETFVKSHDILDEQAGMYSDPPMTVYRYIFPDVKQVDLTSGNERSVNGINRYKFVFFNGDAFYDNGWFVFDERTRNELMIKTMSIQKKFSDCFYSNDITPLVVTERAHIYANKFAGTDKTVWTLYNSRFTTVRGPVLAIEHREGAKYYDAWNDKIISPQIVNGRAIISQKLGPQSLGCIVQYRN